MICLSGHHRRAPVDHISMLAAAERMRKLRVELRMLERQHGPVARFLSFIDVRDPSDCWEWMGSTTGGAGNPGYGTFSTKGETWRAHRKSYEIFNGPIHDDLFVCHSCDNRPCCNPHHLWLGTRKENADDMVRKGRGFTPPPPLPEQRHRGERAHNAKLTEAAVREILASDEENEVLARRFGVQPQTVNVVRKRMTWRHISVGDGEPRFRGKREGTDHHRAALSAEAVAEIRDPSNRVADMVKKWGVSRATAYAVRAGERYRETQAQQESAR